MTIVNPQAAAAAEQRIHALWCRCKGSMQHEKTEQVAS